MNIPFNWLDEEGQRIDTVDHLEITQASLLWASLTVGAPSIKAAIDYFIDLPAFAFHKWNAIQSVIHERGNYAHLRSGFHNLDSSEKGVLSFWTGMIFAKLTIFPLYILIKQRNIFTYIFEFISSF